MAPPGSLPGVTRIRLPTDAPSLRRRELIAEAARSFSRQSLRLMATVHAPVLRLLSELLTTLFSMRSRSALCVALTVVAAGCGGEIVPPGAFRPFSFSYQEAAGDTINAEAGASGRATDLVSMTGQLTGTHLELTLTFADGVEPWSSGLPNALDGFVDFDMDQNPATGLPGAVNEYGGTSGVGSEAYLSLRDDGAGHIAIVKVADFTATPVSGTFTGKELHIMIPRSYLTSPTAETIRVSAVVGNRDRPATDFAPDSDYFEIAR